VRGCVQTAILGDNEGEFGDNALPASLELIRLRNFSFFAIFLRVSVASFFSFASVAFFQMLTIGSTASSNWGSKRSAQSYRDLDMQKLILNLNR
jgi:hypothetical protein